MSERTWQGIPREEIPWFPKVDLAKCEACGTCVDFCRNGVYDVDEADRPVVVKPYNCVVGCSTCAAKCPNEAISFPPLSILLEIKKAHGVTG